MTTSPDSSDLPIGSMGSVVTVGTFDGVHRGHHDVLSRLATAAQFAQRPSVVVTFDPHPLEIVRPADAPPLLTLHHEKLEQMVLAGPDYVAVLPFTDALAACDAEQFVQQILLTRYRMTELLVGHDHGMGRGRLGDASVLQELGRRLGFTVTVLPPVRSRDGQSISSTRIRTALAAGDLETAQKGLGRPYSLSGRVVHGDQRGRTIGYPTLNLESPDPRKLLPLEGVYAVEVQTVRGPFGGMLNLGPRPTFADARHRIETHLFDVSGDWYGARIRVDLIARLRDTCAFSDVGALQRQLALDEAAAREVLKARATAAAVDPLS